MISVEGFSKKFGDFTAVRDVSFTVEDGEVFGIVGPNGAGKSTIVKMLATILAPTEGTATIAGLDIRKDSEEIRKIVGYLPEEPRIYDYMTGREFLDFFAQLYPSHADVDSLLKFMDIEEHAQRKVGEYSKGLRQRLSIARALVNNPKILILDEPTMGLDPASARELREKILEMKGEGKTMVVCTHYMDEADFLCDNLCILDRGGIAAMGMPEELKATLAKQTQIRIVLKKENPEFVKLLKAKKTGRFILVPAKSVSSGLKAVADAAAKTRAEILNVDTPRPSLEDVFISVTKKKK